ncbi:hypothetical protein BDV93DRAFT_265597 [Ceratobasidium sp. AG-I]|nr:hypothetical protein BDV93DRAFT_265597 [Ceratobasidium sp. AG-I]
MLLVWCLLILLCLTYILLVVTLSSALWPIFDCEPTTSQSKHDSHLPLIASVSSPINISPVLTSDPTCPLNDLCCARQNSNSGPCASQPSSALHPLVRPNPHF